MKIRGLAKNYLKTTLILSHQDPYVHSVDIANELSFSRPNISVTMKNLHKNGYILMDDRGHITLSSIRKEIAETIYERHTMLFQWFICLGVDRQTAVKDAYRIEHMVSAESFRVVKDHITDGRELPGYSA